MIELILKAIADRRLLRFGYKGEYRTVEPHAYGRQFNGSDALCAWQIAGGSGTDFRLFLIDEMSGISLEDGTFDGPRDGYRTGDKRFAQIYAEL